MGGAQDIVGVDRYDTAARVATSFFPASTPFAGLANGTSFPDALAGGAHIATLGGPLLLTQATQIPTPTSTCLTTQVTHQIELYGGITVINQNLFGV